MAARDIAVIGALVFAFALGFFILHFALNTTITAIIAVPEVNQSAGAVESFQAVSSMTERFDYIVFGLFIGLTLALIISGWFVGGYPIFMFLYFIVIVVSVVLSAGLSNVWETVSQSAQFGMTVVSFPIANNLLLNLPLYVAVVGFIGITVMFVKPFAVNEVSE